MHGANVQFLIRISFRMNLLIWIIFNGYAEFVKSNTKMPVPCTSCKVLSKR